MPVEDFAEQIPESLLLVVHARSKVRHDLKGPALTCAVDFQDLLLPLQIVLLIVAGHPGIGDRAACHFRCLGLLGTQTREIVAPPPARSAFVGDEFAFALPPPQRLRRDT